MKPLRGKFQVQTKSYDIDRPGVVSIALISAERFQGPDGAVTTGESMYDSVGISVSDPEIAAVMDLGKWFYVDLSAVEE